MHRGGTYAFGNAFEHFVILECKRLIRYSGNQFELNFVRTYDDQEVDLVVQRPGKPLLLIEIKATTTVTPENVKQIVSMRALIDRPVESAIFSCDPVAQIINEVRCLHWQQGLREYFTGPDLNNL